MGKGADPDAVAASMGYSDGGWGQSPMEQALQQYADLLELAKNGTITKDGLAELERVAKVVDYAAKAAEDAAKAEKDAADKRMDAAKRDADAARLGQELKAKSKLTDEGAGIYDKLHGLMERMADAKLSKQDQQAILGRELAKMIKGAVKGNQESISANGVARLKDFKFTDYTQVQVDTLAEIKKQGEIAKEQLATGKSIAQKLPTPTMAQ